MNHERPFNSITSLHFHVMIILLTTVPGIEDIVINEVKELFRDRVAAAEVFGSSNVTGKVLVNVSGVTINELKTLGTVEHVVMVLDIGNVGKDVGSLRDCIWRLRLDELLNYYTPNTTIGIMADRSGDHEFRSPDAAALLGERISEFLASMGIKPLFNLDNADLTLRLIIDQDKCVLGISITRKPLRNRPYRRFNHPAALNPILANAMFRVLSPAPSSRVCDITCGSGTIVIEGALLRRDVSFLCIDIDYGYVSGALMNAREAGVDYLVDFVVMDSTRPAIRDNVCAHAIFNPPFGIRIEPLKGVTGFYDSLLRALRGVLRDGSSAVFITVRKSLVRKILAKYGFRIMSERVVEQGGIWSSIFKVVRE